MKLLNQNLLLPVKNHPLNNGFTMTESLVALFILSITLSIMLPAFMYFGIENTKARMRTGGIAVSNSILSDLRTKDISDLDVQLGETTLPEEEHSGFRYIVTQYICTDLTGSPLNADNPDATCSETVAQNDLSRQILLKVKVNDVQVYRVQTVFSRLKS